MNIWENYINSWKNIFNYKGKVGRKEYWWDIFCISLINLIIFLLRTSLFNLGGTVVTIVNIVFWIINLLVFLQYLSLSVRRLHSANLASHYQWFMLIPVIIFFIHCLPDNEINKDTPCYTMLDNGEKISLQLNKKGYVTGIVPNAFKYMLHNLFNFKGKVNRGNYLWAWISWKLVSVIYEFLSAVVVTCIFLGMLQSHGQLGQMAMEAYMMPSLVMPVIIHLFREIVIICLFINIPVWVPKLALKIRRLREQEISPWWGLLILIRTVGQLVLMIVTLMPSKNSDSEFPSYEKEKTV